MKTTEKVLGMIALGILFLVAGIVGLIGIYLTAQPGLAYGIPIILILCGLLELYLAYDKHRSYATNPEVRKRDEIGARDERSLLIRLKATNAASAGVVFFFVILIQGYGIFLADYLDSLLWDTLTILRFSFIAVGVLWIVLYAGAYFIFQRIN